jgi:hypothetical protein
MAVWLSLALSVAVLPPPQAPTPAKPATVADPASYNSHSAPPFEGLQSFRVDPK